MQEIQLFKKFLEIEMERQKAMQELSETLGIDVSFSNEEMLKNAQDSFVKAISQRINEDLQKALRI
jgi:DNA-binding ferritin-like protein (Dps family)